MVAAAAGYGIAPENNGGGEEARSEVTLHLNPADQSGATLFQGIFFGTGPVAKAIPDLGGSPSGRISDPEFRYMAVKYLQDKVEGLRQTGADEAAARLAALSGELEASGSGYHPGPATLSSQEFDTVTRFLLEEIADEDPRFFPTFARYIRSGDHVQIREALLDAEKVLQSTLDRIATPQLHTLVASLLLPQPSPYMGRPLPGPNPYNGIHVNVNVEINTALAIQDIAVIASNTFVYQNAWVWKSFRLVAMSQRDRLVNAMVVNTIANRLRG
jgi:hypothetical protein